MEGLKMFSSSTYVVLTQMKSTNKAGRKIECVVCFFKV